MTTTLSMPRLVPPATADPSSTDALRAEVRSFLADQLASGAFTPSVDAWLSGWDETFTAALAARGWLGMTVPKEYGGHGRSFLERFVVTEELLAAGAPVAAAPPLVGAPVAAAPPDSPWANTGVLPKSMAHATSPAITLRFIEPSASRPNERLHGT